MKAHLELKKKLKLGLFEFAVEIMRLLVIKCFNQLTALVLFISLNNTVCCTNH